MKEAEFVKKKLKEIAGSSPLFLCADFNSPGGQSPTWKSFNKDGFKDAWLNAEKRIGSEVTWCGFKKPNLKSKHRIDWVLFKGNIKIKECETVNFHKNGRYPSDHFPVFSKLIIQ